MDEPTFDVILVGGGLANGLIAWRLKMQQPALRILLVEKEGVLGGNHTWSFYQRDLTPAQHAWMAPLVVQHWPGYQVRFPLHSRTLQTPCYSITSERFHEVLIQALGASVLLNATVGDVDAESVRINGRRYRGKSVIDGRGHMPSAHMRYAYQKFIGHEVILTEPHGQALPIIMDATVAQDDGYRFVYTLPFSENRILVEDTYYGTTPDLDFPAIRKNIAAYITARGWQVASLVREEIGVLPISLSGDMRAFWQAKPQAMACSGLRAGLFHATTGYSLLYAVRLADEIAASPALGTGMIYRHIHQFSLRQWRSQRFMRLLNRMLFFASAPPQRYRLLQRFYRLPQNLIERFYAAQLFFVDKLRILLGKPPVPVMAAVRAMMDTKISTNINVEKETSSKPS
ncbi:MAG: lycopene beta-cyclase CrtY [Pseudomonadota bacterium]